MADRECVNIPDKVEDINSKANEEVQEVKSIEEPILEVNVNSKANSYYYKIIQVHHNCAPEYDRGADGVCRESPSVRRVVGAGSSAPTLGPDNVEYAIYLVKRTLRNKQRHGLEEYEQEALANLKKNLAAKWDSINMQAEEQIRLAKERKKGDKIVSDSQERAYWRVARPPPGVPTALEPCPVSVRARHPSKPKKRSIQQITREIEHLKPSLNRTRVKTSTALEAIMAYSETFAAYDPWLTQPQPSNAWITDDTLFWQINSQEFLRE